MQDLQWRHQQLQTQYDYLVAQHTSQKEGSKHNDVKLEVPTHADVIVFLVIC